MPPKRRVGDPLLAIAYIRVSTEDQNLGPKAQQAQIERYCQQAGITLADSIKDHGVSGGSPIDKRPGLLHAISLLKSTGAGVLIVAKRDRLARDVMIAAMLERLVERGGAVIVSADGAGNGVGPEQELMRGIVNLFAQYERALTSSRTKAAAAAKKALGERWGGVAYGLKVGVNGKTLEPHEGEQNVIEMIKTHRENGFTLRQVTAWLNEAGVPCRGRRWHLTTVARLCARA